MGNELENPGETTRPDVRDTWPGFFSRLAELVTESWVNVARLSVFVLVLAILYLALWPLHGLFW